MMDDLISRQAALDALMGAFCDTMIESICKDTIEALPSAQPEQSEIIRCKDCKRWNTVINRKKAEYGLCQIQTQLKAAKRDDWCSRAERITDEVN